MDVTLLQRKHRDHQTAMLREGFLDDQFNQLQKLQDESTPYFVMEVVTLFFGDSEKLLNSIALALEQKPVDFKSVDAHVHQFKGSSASVGAARVKDVCTNFRNICEAQNLEGEYASPLNPKYSEFTVCFFKSTFGRAITINNTRCMNYLQQLQHEYSLLKNNLQYLFRLQQEIQAAGGSISPVE